MRKIRTTAIHFDGGIIRYVVEYKNHWWQRWRFIMDGRIPCLFHEKELHTIGKIRKSVEQ